MVAGHLREKNGYFHIVLNYTDMSSCWHTKLISTGLFVKGNKKRAESLLMKTREEFKPVNTPEDRNTLFADFLSKWLAEVVSKADSETYTLYTYNTVTFILPYFTDNAVTISKLNPAIWSSFGFVPVHFSADSIIPQMALPTEECDN